MKRIIAAALTLTLSLSMGTVVYADASLEVKPSSTEIRATYQAGTVKNDAIYSVDIEWGDLEYTYSQEGVKTWNPTELKYEIKNSGTPTWSCAEGADKIKVINNSNVGITANLTYSKKNTLVEGTFDHAKINLKSAEGTEAEKGPSGTATLSLTGNINENESPDLGEVKITVGEFVGEKVTDSSIISAPNLKSGFYTTAEDGVFTSSGTISNKEEIDLTKLSIGGKTHKMVTSGGGIVAMKTAESKVFEVDLVEDPSTISNGFYLYPREGTYNYVLTINTNTKKVTVVLSE